ncbi:hypothetical protein CHS0354_011741 [Potamilus streckersoni]|uniref:Uncharacterized protein n=1 Tax=Potamilus streckersoni TaxID=2493646 RepID=A0AAE0W4P4_9BIVA|nr:hypothetical protein CHS0354_011741 [Potamilus streckersoni]
MTGQANINLDAKVIIMSNLCQGELNIYYVQLSPNCSIRIIFSKVNYQKVNTAVNVKYRPTPLKHCKENNLSIAAREKYMKRTNTKTQQILQEKRTNLAKSGDASRKK